MVDPYIQRKLPYLIGTKEFMDDDCIGLMDEFSESEEIDDNDNCDSDADIESGNEIEVEHGRKYLSTSSRIKVHVLPF